MNKLPITVCMISGPEASRIARALEAVAGWVSEIIIVLNDDVNDGTEEIAARFGAKVFREPWKGYVAQKNSAAEKARHDWLLGLDADEVVSAELRDEIAQILAKPSFGAGFAAFNFPRCSFYCGRWIRHGDWYPDRQTRLWRRGQAQWEGKAIHEKLVVHGQIGRLRGDLLHYSMENLDRQLTKIGVYGNHFAQYWLAQGRKPGGLDLVVRPLWRFFRCYFLRLGFLDGWVGYYLAWQTAFACLTRYAKVREALAAAPPGTPPAAPARLSCSISPSSSSPATPAR